MNNKPAARLPFEPLRRIIASRVVMYRKDETGNRDGLGMLWPNKSWQATAYMRAQQEGSMTWRSADRLAIYLGLHPALIWGEAWWAIEDQTTEAERREQQRKETAA